MSRPLRLHAPGYLHHLFARGNNKGQIFHDNRDCESFLELLAKALKRFGADCAGYCLLDTHYHLLLVPHEHPISRVMHQLNSTYCQRFNRRHQRVGHVLQGRFGYKIVEDGEYARSALRYVALNPVAAGLAPVCEAWPWSSYRAAMGLDRAPDFLALQYAWSAFGTSEPEVGRARFAAFIRAGSQEIFDDTLLHGSAAFAAEFTSHLERHHSNWDFVYAHRFSARITLGALFDGRMSTCRLEDAAHAAFHQHGYTLAEIGRVVSRNPSTVCRWIQRAASRQSG